MKRLFNQDVKTLGLNGILLLCLVYIADLEVESILMFSLKYPGTDKFAHFSCIWFY